MALQSLKISSKTIACFVSVLGKSKLVRLISQTAVTEICILMFFREIQKYLLANYVFHLRFHAH